MKFSKVLILSAFFSASFAFAATKENISVDKLEVYSDKSKIPDLRTNGGSIPANTRIIVFRTNSPTLAGWKFVAYGNAASENLSILLSAKAMNKTVSCVWEDRGNYWVECVGLTIE